jgi:hypothetical protein
MSDDTDSPLFTYGAPLFGVFLVAVGIAAAVPGAYAIIQEDITTCGTPSIAVDTAEETEQRFGENPPLSLTRVEYSQLSPAEQTAFDEALVDPVSEARIEGPSPTYQAFLNGTLVTYEGEQYYVTVVAENPCFTAAPLQFPLGVFAIALGVVGILTPPAYRKLVSLERDAN